MEDKINALYTLSRKYFIDILADIKNKTMEITEQLDKIYKDNRNNLPVLNEFENDIIVKGLIDDLNEIYPHWTLKKQILYVILRNIESKSVDEFHSLKQIKEAIIQACHEAEIDERIHFPISNEMKIKVCDEVKKNFYDYINKICDEDLARVKPLFYRRVLTKDEIDKIMGRIETFYYDPKLEKGMYLCFKQEDFNIEFSCSKLINILSQQKISKIYEINNGGLDTASYLMDLSEFDPYCIDGFNIYWCTEQLDWIFLKDHEGYYIIYGQWLINEIKKAWTEWSTKQVYIS